MLVQRDHQAALLVHRPFQEQLRAQHGLTHARNAHHHRHRAIEDPAPEELVQGTRADNRLPGAGRGLDPIEVAGWGLGTAEHLQPTAGGDAQRVAARVIVLAAALHNLQAAADTPPVALAAQNNDRVGQVLGNLQGEGLLLNSSDLVRQERRQLLAL